MGEKLPCVDMINVNVAHIQQVASAFNARIRQLMRCYWAQLHVFILGYIDCSAHMHPGRIYVHFHPHARPDKQLKRPFKAVSISICPFPSKWVENGGTGAKQAVCQITENPQMVSIKVFGLLAEWDHGVWRSFLKALVKYPLSSHLRPSLHVCLFVGV